MRTKMKASNLILIISLFVFVIPCYAASAKYISIGTSGSGGTYAMAGAAIAKILNKYNPELSVTIEATPGGGDGNIRLLGKGKINFGIGTSSSAYLAYKSEDIFSKEKFENIRTGIVGMYTTYFGIIPAKSPIKSFSQFKGLKIGTYSARNKFNTEQVLSVYGLKKGDYKLSQFDVAECAEELKDGNIDAIMGGGFSPVSSFTELATFMNLRFIGHDNEQMQEKVLNLMRDNTKVVLEANTYKGQPQTLLSHGSLIGLFVNVTTNDRLAYSVFKTILEHPKELEEIYKPVGLFTLENQKKFYLGRNGDIVPPYHPGVLIYLKEKGVLK